MTYTEKELDQFLHGISLSLLSKKSAQHWRYDEETAKEIEWLEALERKVRADKADRKTEPQTETQTETQNSNLTFEKDECAKEYEELGLKELKELIEADRKTEPQTDMEIAKAIVHRMIDDAVIAEDAYPNLRQKMHNAVDEYEPQTQLTAKCLNCNNSKACKEKHWDGCVYEPKDEKTCETCRHWKYIAHEWQCEACKCQGYEPKDEPQTPYDNCQSCLHWVHDGYWYCECNECRYEPKDECAKEYEELGLKELKELIKADRKTEPQTERNE